MASCVAQTLPHSHRPHLHRHLSASGAPSTVHATLLNDASSSTLASATAAVFGTNDSHEEGENDRTLDAPLNGHDGIYEGQNGRLTAVSPSLSMEEMGACPSSSVSLAHTIVNNSTDSMDRGVTGTMMTTLPSLSTTKKTITIWSLPPECLSMIVRSVAARGVQDLFPLLCVNKAFFHLVVPVLYREPFRVAALLVWKQTGYRGMIERQTKLIRTLLHCCTRAVEKVPPSPCEPSSSIPQKPIAPLSVSASAHSLVSSCATVSTLPGRTGSQSSQQPPPSLQQQQQQPQQQQQQRRQQYGIRRIHPKQTPPPAQYPVQAMVETQSRRSFLASFRGSSSSAAVASTPTSTTSTMGQSPSAGVASPLSTSSPSASSSSSSTTAVTSSNHANSHTKRYTFPLIRGRNRATTSPSSKMHSTTTAMPFPSLSTASTSSNCIPTSSGPLLKPKKRKIEMIPVIWNEEKKQPETASIPGLENQRSIPPDLAKTVMELRHDPPPMTNYLAYVAHTDVRAWSAALNLPFVDQILGPKYTWRSKLVKFLKDVPSMATGGVFGNHDTGHGNHGDSWTHLRRRRRHRGRTKGVWGYHDVDFLELLLVYYTSPNIESLSLGIVCSRNYFTMEEMPSPRIHERLTRLKRIEIDVEAMSLYATAPQQFIRRHQQMFPGQLREIQIRQSYYYTYDMSKSVLDIIHAMDRIEVLDLSVWMGTFSGFETIRTEHLRKLMISHHIDITDQHMFDQLLEKCPVLEELSIVVTHPDMFLWAVKRKHEEDKKRLQQITTRCQHAAEAAHDDGGWKGTATGCSRGERGARGGTSRNASCNGNKPNNNNSNIVLGKRGDLRPRLLPPLKSVVFSGPTLDVVSALKHVFFAFRETLESVHVNMHPDASLQLYMHNLDPSFEHLSSASSSSVPIVSPFNTVDAIPLQAATAAAASLSPGAGLPSNFPYPIEIYNHQHLQQQQQQQQSSLHQHEQLQPPLHSHQSSLDDPMASSSSLLPWTPHGSSIHPWGHSHHHQQSSVHGYGHGFESLSTSGPSVTPLWALRHRHFLSESRLTPMLGGISMAVQADRRTRRERAGACRNRRRKAAASRSVGNDDNEADDEGDSEDEEEEVEEEEDRDEEEDVFFPTFEQVACPSPYCLSWSWILPKLRTLSIRGPLATQFSMHLTQFCPRLETVHISSSHGYVVRHQPFI